MLLLVSDTTHHFTLPVERARISPQVAVVAATWHGHSKTLEISGSILSFHGSCAVLYTMGSKLQRLPTLFWNLGSCKSMQECSTRMSLLSPIFHEGLYKSVVQSPIVLYHALVSERSHRACVTELCKSLLHKKPCNDFCDRSYMTWARRTISHGTEFSRASHGTEFSGIAKLCKTLSI